MDDCLTREESFELLAKAADLKVENLPKKEAEKIYKYSYGNPMAIASIARMINFNKEDARQNVDRWQDYVKRLKDESCDDTSRRHSGQFLGPLDACIQLRLDNLPGDKLNFFKYFAVFEKNVNITPQVLMTLWDLSKEDVEEIMNFLDVKKSLTTRTWNNHLNCYVYGVHNLILESLKKRFANEVMEFHIKLVDNYSRKCDGKFWNLENDNYIFLYLGYHLERAQYFNRFPEVFLNLDFVNTKIKAVGLRDMTKDFQKYGKYIAVKESDKKMLNDLVTFIDYCGHTIQYAKDIDIIQLGLQQPSSSQVYQTARSLAIKRNSECNSTFLKFLYSPIDNSKSIGLRGDETTACFGLISDEIVIGTQSGDIKRRSVSHNTILMTFRGHKLPIKFLKTSPLRRQYLLSINTSNSCHPENPTVKNAHEIRVWDFAAGNIHGTNGSSDGDRSPSPILQDGYFNMFTANENVQCFPVHKDTICCAQISPKCDSVISCSKDQQIYRWSLTSSSSGNCKCKSVPTFCTYSLDGSIIFVSQENNDIAVYDSILFRIDLFPVAKSVIAIYPITGIGNFTQTSSNIQCEESCHDLVLVMDELVQIIRYEPNASKNSRNKNEKNKNYEILCSWIWESSFSDNYKCQSCFNEEFKFLAVTTTRHNVCVYNLEDGEVLKKYETNGEVLSLDTIKGSNDKPLLMAVCKDKSVFIWEIIHTPVKPNFSCLPVWKNNEPIIAFPGNSSCQVMAGREVICTLEMNEGLEVAVTCHILSGTYVAVGTNEGNVWLHTIKNRKRISKEIKISFDPPNVMESTSNTGNKKRPSVSNSDVVFVRIFYVGDKLLIIAIDSNNIIKVLYDDEEYQYNAASKVVGCFFIPESNQIIIIENKKSIKLLSIDLKSKKIKSKGKISINFPVQACDVSTNANDSSYIVLIPSDTNLIFLTTLEDLQKSITNIGCGVLTLSQPTCCSFSPDGKQLAVGFNDGTLKIYLDLPILCSENSEGLFHLKQLGTRPIKAVCLGSDLVFGALGLNRVYLGNSHSVGTAQLTAEQICKDVNSDKFVTIDSEGTVHVITFYPIEISNSGWVSKTYNYLSNACSDLLSWVLRIFCK